ncbi:hypothetical protein LZZ90_02055 [Flavobacterium sp. SM15]|uniref:hypothetical protein n=1 Tax=Flavobacterium sp. SM15 TaxID=2908005 RepID=UPI001EDA607F|nr:hypothetical protein [Flavobacterium sp. SM15]MCG2610287.1 hypothetical protein [Flavobacterium sp. SM15]
MKKLLLILLIPTATIAQVGIGTANPQKDLHVAGSTSTIRIEKLNSVNGAPLNDGVKLAPVYVDKDGELTLYPPNYASGGGVPGTVAPLNFLINVGNFIPDGTAPYYNGIVLNNDTTTTTASMELVSVPFSAPQAALIEVKYGVTIIVSGTDMITTPAGSTLNDRSARTYELYFCIDLNNDGLDATELSKQYGNKGQSYTSLSQGIMGYPYMNAHGYANIPAGNHSLRFFAKTTDGTNKYTSIGFGGDLDYLKIRLYN